MNISLILTCGSECNCTYGLVIFKDKLGRGVGIGVKMKEYIKPLIPKSSWFRMINEHITDFKRFASH